MKNLNHPGNEGAKESQHVPGSTFGIRGALRYGVLLAALSGQAQYAGAAENPGNAVSASPDAEKPPTPPLVKDVELNVMQLRTLLRKEYDTFASNPSQEQGVILVRRILDVSVLDEAKNSPALLRAIAQETANIARQSKSLEAQQLALSFASTCNQGGTAYSLYSKQELLQNANIRLRQYNGDGEYRMALAEIDSMETLALDAESSIRKSRVTTLTTASTHPQMRTNPSAKIDLASVRLHYGQLYLHRYISAPEQQRDEEDLATARKFTQLAQPLVQPFLNKTSADVAEAKMIDDAKGISRELSVTNKAIIAIGKKPPMDADGHRSIGEFHFIEGRWESALIHLRQGQSPFVKKYDPEFDPATSKRVDIVGADQKFRAGLQAWQDAKQMPDMALCKTMERYAGYLFAEARKDGINGISLVTINDVFSKNPDIEPTSTIPEAPSIPVIAASTTVKPAQAVPTVQGVPASSEKPAVAVPERKFAEQLLMIGAQLTVAAGGESRPVNAMKDLPQGDLSITSITLNKGQNFAWMAYLPNLKSVTTLKVTECAAGDREFAVLAQMPNLQVLSITNTAAGPQTLALASKLPIKVLRIDGVRVDDASIANFANNKDLTYLGLFGTQLNDRSLAILGTLENLTFANFSGNKQLTANGIHAFLEKNKNLKTLELSGCSINDIATQVFPLHPNITSLNLAGTPISGFSVGTLSKCHTLKTLNVSGTNLTPADKEKLQQNLKGCVITK